MKHSTAGGLAIIMAVTPLSAGGGAPLPVIQSEPAGSVVVDITSLRSTDGKIIACLTADPQRFPKCRNDREARRMAVAADSAGHLVFRDVPAGRYAIALLHDENGNGKADRALTMIPREGFGFSNDAKVRMGPPKFEDAAFRTTGTERRMTIRMRYML